MNDAYRDMPPLVDSNVNVHQPNIPPPPLTGGYPPPQNTYAVPGWNAPMHHPYPPFQNQAAAQDEWARWTHYYQTQAAAGRQSMPSPYVPHMPMNPETAQHNPRGRSHSTPAAFPFNPQQEPASWNAWGPSMSHHHARPPIQTFPSTTSSHTPPSAVSMSRSLSASYVPPDWPGEPPRSWRRDFKFKSGLSSIFRSKSVTRLPEASTDSARLTLATALRSDKAIILDLRRSQHLLRIQALQRPVVAHDLMQPATNPPTPFMRLYHKRLPWYIDVMPIGNGSYVTLGDLFMGICQFLAERIRDEDYHNDELDAEDRGALRQAWEERCKNQRERMDGVKRVDFLREKYMFLGLTRGKSGMWQLRTGRDSREYSWT